MFLNGSSHDTTLKGVPFVNSHIWILCLLLLWTIPSVLYFILGSVMQIWKNPVFQYSKLSSLLSSLGSMNSKTLNPIWLPKPKWAIFNFLKSLPKTSRKTLPMWVSSAMHHTIYRFIQLVHLYCNIRPFNNKTSWSSEFVPIISFFRNDLNTFGSIILHSFL